MGTLCGSVPETSRRHVQRGMASLCTSCGEIEMTTIQACVNPRLLTKASRLFTGTLEGRIIELLQNARRAGATRVEITNANGVVTVQDNGCGIDDFGRLLDLGGSGWEDELEASEDPAGVGLFCLAPRAVTIRSKGQMIRISNDGWHGAPVRVSSDPKPVRGTIVQFEDDEWSHASVSPLAVFTGMDVAVDDCPCPREPFITDQAVHRLELGCRIEVRETEHLNPWHRRVRRSFGYGDNVLVNFHGQTTSFDFHLVNEHELWFLVDLTGEPTGIRLMLPARTQLVENKAFAQLKATLELEAYRYLQRRGHHQLPYKQYVRARELGITLPEATPTPEVGIFSSDGRPEPVEVKMPEGFPLERCYRYDPYFPGEWAAVANVSLLAALGTFAEPFVPLCISPAYDGYSWAKLPTIGEVQLQVGEPLHSTSIGPGRLTCVSALAVSVQTSDGKTFASPVCMAVASPRADCDREFDPDMLVTRDARERLRASEIGYHFDVAFAGKDTYGRQLNGFERELDRFWADLVGPNERLRRSVLEALAELKPPWHSVTVLANGQIQVMFNDGAAKTI
jgi:hypothetical protein